MRTRSGGYWSRMGVRVPVTLAITFPATGCGEGAFGPGAAPDVVESEVLAAMTEAIQDEYRAEMIYLGVIDDFGEVRPFANIVYAEVRHSDALALLFLARGLAVPASEWNTEELPAFAALSAACQAGVQAEIDNAAIYEKYFSLDLPADVRQVFENNQAASLNAHLPAFERCS